MIAVSEVREGHVLEVLRGMAAGSVHCCLTSPPYWGLRDYKLPDQDWGDWTGSLGLEPTIELYLTHLTSVFDEVRRVIRDDATLWVNLGDSYASGNSGERIRDSSGGVGHRPRASADQPSTTANPGFRPLEVGHGQPNGASGPTPAASLKPLDLCNIPLRFALEMQERGWYHRSTIIWAKGLSFCESYSGSVMPESINGWRWERCRVKTGTAQRDGKVHPPPSHHPGQVPHRDGSFQTPHEADWSDCPGCEKCSPHGGYVLRKGSWRPTSAFEYLFMFAKTADYFCDAEAVREPHHDAAGGQREYNPAGRNPRSVWAINPQPFPDAHFATFPEKLVEPIIQVSTSEKGVCPECGSPWARVVESRTGPDRPNRVQGRSGDADRHGADGRDGDRRVAESTTLGWRPTCGCHDLIDAESTAVRLEYPPAPATVLDPFSGSGTTLLVARKLGRHSIGIELSEKYAQMARKRIAGYAPLFSGPVL